MWGGGGGGGGGRFSTYLLAKIMTLEHCDRRILQCSKTSSLYYVVPLAVVCSSYLGTVWSAVA